MKFGTMVCVPYHIPNLDMEGGTLCLAITFELQSRQSGTSESLATGLLNLAKLFPFWAGVAAATAWRTLIYVGTGQR